MARLRTLRSATVFTLINDHLEYIEDDIQTEAQLLELAAGLKDVIHDMIRDGIIEVLCQAADPDDHVLALTLLGNAVHASRSLWPDPLGNS
eukprot:10170145-Lingulodinium_polyedra.AAC.1